MYKLLLCISRGISFLMAPYDAMRLLMAGSLA